MTPRSLLLIGVLLAAAADTGASPAPQPAGVIIGSVLKVAQKTKPTTVTVTDGDKKPSVFRAIDSSKVGSVTVQPSTSATKIPTSSPTTKPRSQPARKQTTVTASGKSTTESTTRSTVSSISTTARPTTTGATTKPTPAAVTTTAAPVTGRTTTQRRRTTTAPAFIADEVIFAPVCALMADSSLKTRKFTRNYLHGVTTCRCQSRKKAGCLVTTLYPTVRPGSASAAHAQEQSDVGSAASSVLAANIWAMRHECERRALAGAVCHFGLSNKEPVCDCSVEV
ncbi:flocculation protein FLO11-like [Amphibalanus amphitrite]|uniref:flocculation protein FLO11-like n=1 Tax=Amphibalanus amphitrite TaxID=1232801 RepID=UPI001C90D6EC|nr:flocculation protein FLO11-like [Amphibalanus amphitrite]